MKSRQRRKIAPPVTPDGLIYCAAGLEWSELTCWELLRQYGMKYRSKGELHRATLAAVEEFNKRLPALLGLDTARWDLDHWRVVASEFVPGYDYYKQRNLVLELIAQRGKSGEFRQQ